jgi:hypothetical protein
MFSIVHVILPMSDQPPVEAIRASLARFQRGERGDLPDEWLTFHDETSWGRALYEADLTFTDDGRHGLRIEGGDPFYLNTEAVRAEMARLGRTRWTVCFAKSSPDLDAFFDQFITGLERHPVSGGYGRWLNPLGRWDWWDLGGRFDGRITGGRRRSGRAVSQVSSGPNPGRAVLASINTALDEALANKPPPVVEVGVDENIELVSRLLEDARLGLEHAFPGAVLLPPGSLEDRFRWVRSWPTIGPQETLGWLGLNERASWTEVIVSIYARFSDHWAAGVAYHL